MGQLQALLWDVDGTLAETERDGHRRAFNRSFAELGLDLHWAPEVYGQWLAISGGRERLQAALAQHLRADPEPALLEALLAAKQRQYRELVAGGELRLRPGVAALIRAAAAAGLRQAIVTTSGRASVAALASSCLGDLAAALEFWVCGEDVARKKPDPQAYSQAMERLELPPAGGLALEDSGNGVAAAASAGLACLAVPSHYGQAEPESAFRPALAVVSTLGDGAVVRRGPPCGAGGVDLAYLQRLLADRPLLVARPLLAGPLSAGRA